MFCRREKALLGAQEPPLQEHELINDREHPPARGQLSRLVLPLVMRASWVQAAAC